MTIDHHCTSDHDDMFPPSSARAHARRALVQASRHAAAVAIARWSGAAAVAPPARAAWLADAQAGLQQWFDAGGFGQDDGDAPRAPAEQPPCPGTRPHFYTLFRNAGSNAME